MAAIDMPAGGSPDNPAMQKLDALIAELVASDANAEQYEDDFGRRREWEAAAFRCRDAKQALLDFRPSDPTVLVAWFRSLLDESHISHIDDDWRPALEHVAGQIERLARRSDPPAGPLSNTY